jgi:sodium-coupled monocarboxylate transporter 8/12
LKKIAFLSFHDGFDLFLLGLFSYLLIFLVKNIPGLVQAWLGIFGVLGGPVLGVFSLGLFLPWANSKGALTGEK